MKVIKRDGTTVDFDPQKIVVAIEKANAAVEEGCRIEESKIKEIAEYVHGKNRPRLLVEDIQDIVERQLQEAGKFDLAKAYIIYRYRRALVRKSNTTDESILTLIRNSNKDVMEENSNKNAIMASTQRDLIAGEVSKDLTRRVILPEKIAKAHEEGVLHFHDMDYFIQPIFNCCLINIGDMLDNGTVMNGKMIESPRSFQVACNVMTQIIASVASSQYGGQSVDVRHLGKYLRRSRDKFMKRAIETLGENVDPKILEAVVDERLREELKAGVQTIQYQINTLMTTNGQSPFVTLFLYLREDDPYIEENAMIIEEIIRQRLQGIKNEKGVYVTPAFPKLVYVLDENNCLKGGKYDYLTHLAVKCSAKRMYPDYISAKKMRENYEGNVF
ncbi:MAG: anaerobic ribonucleoside-triphosphate reductase, partial [Acidaminococcaceae bacterium]|nr:anaerobic ribonucleoside-triphosphate reductase [Acidaminococcaceae bacterium]